MGHLQEATSGNFPPRAGRPGSFRDAATQTPGDDVASLMRDYCSALIDEKRNRQCAPSERAKAFAKDPSLKKAMQKGGVTGTPQFNFVTATWQDTAVIGAALPPL